MRKIYYLDTNILMQAPYAINAFDEHEVRITDVTLDELDRNKNAQGETGANVREAVRIIKQLRESGKITEGVPLPGGGTFRIDVGIDSESDHASTALNALPEGWDPQKPDHRILRICKTTGNVSSREVILVTNDNAMQLKADIVGVRAEDFKTTRVANAEEQYKGRRTLTVDSSVIDKFYTDGMIIIEQLMLEQYEDESLSAEPVANEFFILRSGLSQSALARYDAAKGMLVALCSHPPWGVTPKNVGQKMAFEALLAPADIAPLVIIKGSAGTAKTFCALAAGLQQTAEDNLFRRVLVARPNIKFDDDIGFLKGSEEEKIAPLIRPIMDNLEALLDIKPALGKQGKEYYSGKPNMNSADYLFDRGILRAEALAYFRGRSINNTYTIIDEAQNMSPNQMFGVVTRAGAGSKIVLIGDPTQIDHPRLDSRNNGLSYASEKMKNNPLCWQLTFSDAECTRSPLAAAAIEQLSPKGYSAKRFQK